MPDDNQAAWNMAAQTATAAMGIASTNKMNRKTRNFNIDMYNAQRKASLDDWNMQNAYNHPREQMKRLREAGLNPNLVYGKGADATATPNRGTDTPSWNPTNPDYSGLSRGVLSYQDTEMKSAQIDNLHAQNQVIHEQAAYLQAQRLALDPKNREIESRISLNNLTAALKRDTYGTDVEYRKQQLKKLVADTDYTINQDARQAATTRAHLRETVARTLNLNYQREHLMPGQLAEINSRINNSQLSHELLALEKDLKSIGVYPGDPWYIRIAARAAQEIKNGMSPTTTSPSQKQAANWRDMKGFR